ncbi:MAG: glycosyltransferase family 4 protein [Cytophagaceae bacterium]|nr:glycosyltransferase family 4 protein [Cytophagaceae bacterium]
MKVIVVSTSYPRRDSPSNGIFIHRQIKALQKLGVECHVLQPVNWFPPLGLHIFHPTWKKGYNYSKTLYDELDGVRIHHPRIFRKMPSRFFQEDPWEQMGNALAKYIRKNKSLRHADLLYTHFLCYEGFAGTAIKRKLQMPLISIARGDDVHAWPEEKPVLRKYLKVVFKEADMILSNSKRLGTDARKWMDAENIREVHTVYNGVEYETFYPAANEAEKIKIKKDLDLSPEKKYLLCIATPIKLKGWLELFDAIQNIGDAFNNWEVIAVAPEIAYKEAIDLKAESHQRDLRNKINHLGKMTPEKVALLMRSSDAFVVPSHNEGMSNALLEAMASGLPVIATDVGGHAEVITHMKEGFLVPPANTQELQHAILKIISDENLRTSMGIAGRNKMLNLGDYKQNAEKLYNLFFALLQDIGGKKK